MLIPDTKQKTLDSIIAKVISDAKIYADEIICLTTVFHRHKTTICEELVA